MAQAAATRFTSALGSFELLRYPRRKRETLQAWCAADELLLQGYLELGFQNAAKPSQQTLVANDDHGALCVAMQPTMLWTDSALAAQAVRENIDRNHRRQPELIWSPETPAAHSLALLRVPKQLAYFEYQLTQLARAMSPGATLLCAGMDKHLSPQTAGLIERHFGETVRHPGKRKARLFSAVRNSEPAADQPAPSRYFCEPLGGELLSFPNVFSREQLDIGSRFLLENLDVITPVRSAIDLACGAGVLGLGALQRKLCSELLLCDESAMAIASARHNAATLCPAFDTVRFHHGDGLLDVRQRAELILCNPPFHLGHTVDDFAGRRLLEQCTNCLTSDGHLILVANRHLDYGATLQQHFQRVERFAQNNKFALWRCQHC